MLVSLHNLARHVVCSFPTAMLLEQLEHVLLLFCGGVPMGRATYKFAKKKEWVLLHSVGLEPLCTQSSNMA